MEDKEKSNIFHDAVNSIIVIKNMARLSSDFVERAYNSLTQMTSTNQRQLNIFKNSMVTIQKEAIKLEQLHIKIKESQIEKN